jgi:hypothetical protein
MTEQARAATRPRRPLVGLLAILSVCTVVAVAGAIALDSNLVASRRRAVIASLTPPDRSSLEAPSTESWRSALLPPGTPAPDFSLVDARTGGRVGLREHRGRPVVLLLSSYC